MLLKRVSKLSRQLKQIMDKFRYENSCLVAKSYSHLLPGAISTKNGKITDSAKLVRFEDI